jgi:hypothetical protein
MITSEQMRKIASVLRAQEEEKKALVNDMESYKKEAEVSRAVLHMLKDDLLDVGEIDIKIAEFQSDPKLLKDANDFFAKAKTAGTQTGIDFGKAENADLAFLNALQG